MPGETQNADLAATAIQMILGAGETIELKAKHVDGREFGLNIEDLANSVDKRLVLRCLLPLPGIYRNRDGSIHKDREPEEYELEVLKSSISLLEQAGWQTRLIPDRLIVSSLCVDNDAVIYYNYLNLDGLPGPYLSDKPKDITYHRSQFEAHWTTSFPASETETIYDQGSSLLHHTDPSQIAIVSHEAWQCLIQRLSADPRRLHELPPRKFEELIAELLSRDGLEVQLTPQARDGGRDVLAFHQTPVGRLLYLVECKRHQPERPVGIAIVQRLYGVVAQERATAGLVVTTSRFSKEALAFAETVRHQLGLRDYKELKKWIQKYEKA